MQPIDLTNVSPWICVRSEPHREAVVEANLRRGGFEVYCPRYQRWITHARRRQLVRQPLFPSYLFTRSALGLEAMCSVRRTPGVASLAARDLASAIVSQSVIEAIRAREGADGCVEFQDRFKPGETVQVEGLPLDLQAVFSAREDDHRSKILLSLLGKQHSVTVLTRALSNVA